MDKRIVLLAVVFLSASLALPEACFAIRLLTKEKAMEKVFGTDCEITTETKELSGTELSKVEERLGGSLVHYQKGSKSKKVVANTAIDFHFASKNGKKVGVAIIDAEPGKWGPVEFIIALDLQGTVTKVEVMSYKERRGRPIARRSFMKQFEGKTGKDRLQVRKDITGISGATISSRCACFAVKKAIVLYEELYSRKTASKTASLEAR